MRLLDTRTLDFVSFDRDDAIPQYAILSHTWGDEEVTYKQLLKHRSASETLLGYQKIRNCAELALADGFQYLWADTCCIDKSSSAELSEAINSMFRWYKSAQICYAYLSDTPSRPSVPGAEAGSYIEDDPLWVASFVGSRWFTRGWTLQELIAPPKLMFCAQNWDILGTKEDLAEHTQHCTGIPWDVIVTGDFSESSVAQRMSWAANRTTSRKEDAAYCLMGLFGVNMPMMYGEGTQAFIRLQYEIIKTSDDMSIFAWKDPTASFSTYRGLLSRAPSDFAQCQDAQWTRQSRDPPYQVTNKGIQITLPLSPRRGRPEEYIALLRGMRFEKMPNRMVGVYLQKVGEEQYARVDCEKLALLPTKPNGGLEKQGEHLTSPLFVRQIVEMEQPQHSRAGCIALHLPHRCHIKLEGVRPAYGWNTSTHIFSYAATAHGAVWRPPKVLFDFQLTHHQTGTSNLTVGIEAGRQWGDCIDVNGDWQLTHRVYPAKHRIHCRSQSLQTVELVLQRLLVEGDARLLLRASCERW